MKKGFFIILSFFICILLFDCDMHSGRRPYNYPPAKWVSKEPEMWFEIDQSDNSANTPKEKIYGCLVLDGQNIEIEVFFDRGISVYFNSINDFDSFTRGSCKFHPDKLVVKIDKEMDNFLNGLCKKITFIREVSEN